MHFLKRPNLNYRIKLLISYVLLSLILLLMFAAVINISFTTILKQQVLNNNVETIRQANQNISNYLRDVESLIFNISANPNLQKLLTSSNSDSDYESILEVYEIENTVLKSDVFTRKTGGVQLFAINKPYYPDYNYSFNQRHSVFNTRMVEQEEWYHQVIESHGMIDWQGPLFDPIRNATELSANKLIPSTSDLRKDIAILRVFVPASAILDQIDKVTFDQTGIIAIKIKDEILAGDDPDHILTDLVKEKISSEIELQNQTISSMLIGRDRYYILKIPFSTEDWTMIGVIPARSLIGKYWFIAPATILAAILCLAISLALSYSASRSIARPIMNIAQIMQSFDANLDRRMTEHYSGEINVLVQSYNRMMDQLQELIERVRQTHQKQMKAEFAALQAQINPHFLYNTLEAIKSLAVIHNVKDIADISTALANFFRFSLNKGNEQISLRDEVQQCISYCIIQQYRHKGKFDLALDIPESLYDTQIIKLILQPVVENSIQHGFSEISWTGMIRIGAEMDNDLLILRITDNGIGSDPDYLNGLVLGEYQTHKDGRLSGYGLKNVHDRIRLYFGEQSGLSFKSNLEDEGLTVEIRIHTSARQLARGE